MWNDRNVTLIAVPQRSKKCFYLYLDFSGQREYLMYHRFDAGIYAMLKTGMRMNDIRRWRINKSNRYGRASEKLDNSIRHIILCADDYLAERQSA